MPGIRLWFYDPSSDNEGFINKLVVSMDMPFCHVEAQFEDDSACSVYMGSQVVHRKQTFESSNYACVCVPCTLAKHQVALWHAQELCRSGLAFSSVQMYASII